MDKQLTNTHHDDRPFGGTRRVNLDSDFDEALARLVAARLRYEEVPVRHESFAARIDALDSLNDRRIEMAGLLTGLGLRL